MTKSKLSTKIYCLQNIFFVLFKILLSIKQSNKLSSIKVSFKYFNTIEDMSFY